MGSDGRILSRGAVDTVQLDKKFAKEVKQEEAQLEEVDDLIDSDATESTPQDVKEPPSGQLILSEEMEEGHVSWGALNMFFKGMGGNHPLAFFAAFFGGLGLSETMMVIQTWFLGYWASQYSTHPASEVNAMGYLEVYGAFIACSILGSH